MSERLKLVQEGTRNNNKGKYLETSKTKQGDNQLNQKNYQQNGPTPLQKIESTEAKAKENNPFIHFKLSTIYIITIFIYSQIYSNTNG